MAGTVDDCIVMMGSFMEEVQGLGFIGAMCCNPDP